MNRSENSNHEPTEFFHYYGQIQWVSDVFLNKRVFFPHPSKFNDPFDPPKYHSTFENVGVFTLTPNAKSILMWSHYANSHYGLCIGFENDGKNPCSGAAKIVYKKEDEFYFSQIPENDPLSSLKIKANFWKYENEWRIIETGNGENKKGFYRQIPGRIIRIILGCRFINHTHESKRNYIEFQNVFKEAFNQYFNVIWSNRNRNDTDWDEKPPRANQNEVLLQQVVPMPDKYGLRLRTLAKLRWKE